MPKKILFCYFSPANKHYTPLDLGYILTCANLNKAEYDVEFLHLNQKSNSYGEFTKSAYLIKSYSPDAVFFFLESIVWSKVYALGAALKIIDIYNEKYGASSFLGLQSYKIQENEIKEILETKKLDCVVRKDPEESFKHLGKILKKEKVDGVSYYNDTKNRVIIHEEKKSESEKDLDYIPSPFLEGIFDDFLMQEQFDLKGRHTVYICTSRACPFGCYYCYRSVKFESMRYFSVQRVFDEIEYLFNKFRIFRFFTIDDCFLTSKNRLKEFVSEFKKRKQKNPSLKYIKMLVMSRPELLDEEALQLMHELNVSFIQIGLQTINPELQHYMTRKIEIDKFKEIAKTMHKYDMMLKLDVIIGLPGDTLDYFKKTLDYAISLQPGCLQVKQIYHNPSTLFDLEKNKYEIETETKKRDFAVPYVHKSKNVDQVYQKKAYDYLQEKIQEFPEINWKWLSEFGSYYDA